MAAAKELLEDPLDGLPAQDVGEWAEKKYGIHSYFTSLFTSGVRNRFDELIYIDLFAGCGRAILRKSKRAVDTCALGAVEMKHPFSRYVFADIDPEQLGALEQRIAQRHPDLFPRCHFEPGDSNHNLDNILRHVPAFSKEHTGLTFCFVDPYYIANLKLETLRAVRQRGYTDFLVNVPIGPANRFLSQNISEPNRMDITEALGDPDWRARWERARASGEKFKPWFADQFCRRMLSLGYGEESRDLMEQVRSSQKNLDLYHLVFFSKHALGYDFFRKALRGRPQGDLFR